jgi:transcriptional regulator with XRE-family HTH domain
MTPAEDEQAEDAGMTIGAGVTTGSLLGAARQASGRSIEQIADETRVPRRHLQAIENDEHDALPALPYAMGFVRSFARAVDLDPEMITARFRSETTKQPHVPRVSTLEPLDERRLPGRGVVFATLAGLVLVVAALSAWGAGVFDPAIPDAPLVTAEAPEQLARVAPPPPEMTPELMGSAPTLDVDGTAAVGAIVLTAKEDVWVRIYDPASSLVPISRVMMAGERFEVPSDPPGLLLWTGKAGALDVRVGDDQLLPLGGVAQTLRDVRLTPEALRALAAKANSNVSSGV